MCPPVLPTLHLTYCVHQCYKHYTLPIVYTSVTNTTPYLLCPPVLPTLHLTYCVHQCYKHYTLPIVSTSVTNTTPYLLCPLVLPTLHLTHCVHQCYPLSGWCDGREDCVNGEDEAECAAHITKCSSRRPIIRRPPPAVVHFDGHGGLLVQPMSSKLVAIDRVFHMYTLFAYAYCLWCMPFCSWRSIDLQ